MGSAFRLGFKLFSKKKRASSFESTLSLVCLAPLLQGKSPLKVVILAV